MNSRKSTASMLPSLCSQPDEIDRLIALNKSSQFDFDDYAMSQALGEELAPKPKVLRITNEPKVAEPTFGDKFLTFFEDKWEALFETKKRQAAIEKIKADARMVDLLENEYCDLKNLITRDEELIARGMIDFAFEMQARVEANYRIMEKLPIENAINLTDEPSLRNENHRTIITLPDYYERATDREKIEILESTMKALREDHHEYMASNMKFLSDKYQEYSTQEEKVKNESLHKQARK